MSVSLDRGEHLVTSKLHTLSPSERSLLFKQILAAEHVDLTKLKRLASLGIPGGQGLRAQAWKLLLEYLPTERSLWEGELAARRKEYADFCTDFSVRPSEKASSSRDHPLSVEEGSAFKAHFADLEAMEQIDRDVDRTHSDVPFFGGDDPAAATHREEVKRALFIHAKLNPGLNYVQGMNELIAPLYYVFASDGAVRGDAAHAEADAFFCLMKLMNATESRDLYCKQLDQSDTGVQQTLSRLMARVAEADPSIAAHLRAQAVNPQFFAFRWVTVLFCQDMEGLGNIERAWDYLLGDPDGCPDALMRLCTAMLLNKRTEILAAEFPEIIKILQNCGKGNFDVETIINIAASLGSRYLL